jgi:hypothetical protein
MNEAADHFSIGLKSVDNDWIAAKKHIEARTPRTGRWPA